MAFAEYYDSTSRTDSKEELKPCPFCGSHDVAMKENDIGDTWADIIRYFVECNDCGARGGDAANKFSAVRKWNNRVSPSSEPCYESDGEMLSGRN